jgi:hypothetical protein
MGAPKAVVLGRFAVLKQQLEQEQLQRLALEARLLDMQARAEKAEARIAELEAQRAND